ncbi:MAG: carboxylate-amine ligase [Anaerolineales bacterium]|nr:MAG: carboxylate-amine ligase [Anaerolineales bacterium]
MKTRASLTIGIEEEYQIIDPETRELCSYVQQFLKKGRTVLPDQLRAEFMQSQLEAGTAICRNVKEAREELTRVRTLVRELAEREGLWVGAAGTHPFSSWASQEISPLGRYPEMARFLQDVGRRLLVFGMHVHIGIEDTELLIEVMNGIRQFLPVLLTLSSSSPFWHGRDTGLKSYRSVVFDSLPRTGIPPHFDTYAEYRGYVDLLLQTGSIAEPTHIWWDVRPSEKFPTLEVRISDMCTRLDETLCLAALVQAIVAKLVRLRQEGRQPPIYRRHLMDENKWRSMRYGVNGKLIDFDGLREVSVSDRVEELLAWLDDTVDDLGSREEAEYARTILRDGASADRQLAAFKRSGDLVAVVDHLVEESQEGLD